MHKFIINTLENDPDVNAIVSDRIYAINRAQADAFPFIVVQQVGIEPQDTIDGTSTVDKVFVEVTCYDKPRKISRLEDLTEKVRISMDHMGSSTQNGESIQNAIITDVSYDSEDVDGTSEPILFSVSSWQIRKLR